MAITITPDPEWPGSVDVTGDIQADLILHTAPPEASPGELSVSRYYITLSDGTLLRASYNAERPDFQIVTEGAGTVTIDPSGSSVTISWAVEWIALAPAAYAIGAAQKPVHSLPLFASPEPAEPGAAAFKRSGPIVEMLMTRPLSAAAAV